MDVRGRWAALAVALLGGLIALPATAQEVGFVAAAVGDVQIGSGGSFSAATVDGAVQLGDTVRTGPASSVKLVLLDDSVLTLDGDTTLALDELVIGKAAAGQSSRVHMLGGRLRAEIGEAFGAERRLELETPTAVIGVKGTHYEAMHAFGGGGSSRVCNLGGHVTVTSTSGGGSASPAAGACTFVGKSGAPSVPVPFEQAGNPPVGEGYPALPETSAGGDGDLTEALKVRPPASPPANHGDDDEPYEDALQSLGIAGNEPDLSSPTDDDTPGVDEPNDPRGQPGPFGP